MRSALVSAQKFSTTGCLTCCGIVPQSGCSFCVHGIISLRARCVGAARRWRDFQGLSCVKLPRKPLPDGTMVRWPAKLLKRTRCGHSAVPKPRLVKALRCPHVVCTTSTVYCLLFSHQEKMLSAFSEIGPNARYRIWKPGAHIHRTESNTHTHTHEAVDVWMG